VQVVLHGQAEVAQVLRGVAGKPEGAEDQIGHHGLLGAALGLEENLLQGLGRDLLRQGVAEAL
jgi:hypothetical protein